jgi:starvation-inducible DNA-binding protein
MPRTPTVNRPTRVAEVLQATLVDLIALSLQAKQAHWNVAGPAFRSLHELFDEMTGSLREWYDDVAERLVALRTPADGRPSTVSEAGRVDELPEGQIPDREAVRLILNRVEALAGRIRAELARLGELDPVTQDMLIGIVQGLEKQAWMLRAHKF